MRRLLRDVRIPDQHVLAERDVRPEEHAEAEQQLADVLVVLEGDLVAHASPPLEEVHHQDQRGEEAAARGREEVDAVHRAEPFGLEGHHPVDDGERLRHGIQHHGDRRPALHPLRQPHVARAVLATVGRRAS